MLCSRHGAYQIIVDGLELMSSRNHHSVEAMARLAFAARGTPAPRRVLIGGLGMGYTLRASLDALPRIALVVVAEVLPEVIAWNRGPLASLAGRPLDDPRVMLRQQDVQDLLAESAYDAILLDVDNGPHAFTLTSNGRLYSLDGLARIRRSLTRGGVLAVWSSYRHDAFEKRLRRARFSARSVRVSSRANGKGPSNTVFLAIPNPPGFRDRPAQ